MRPMPRRPGTRKSMYRPPGSLKVLVSVFNGHFHGFTERQVRQAMITTNRCCSLKRGNHDKTTEKGYFLCTAKEGKITRSFVEFKG